MQGIKVNKVDGSLASFGEELTKIINETNRAVVINLLPAAFFLKESVQGIKVIKLMKAWPAFHGHTFN
jgi:hypothetical protein